MTELLTAAQMRAIEQAAIASGEVTGLELMERAGRGVVEAVFEEWPDLATTSHRVVVLCGPGNNGGDGFVVARLLKEWGWDVEVFLYGDPDKLPPDAKVNYERWGALGSVQIWQSDKIDAEQAELFIDAVFGTGLVRSVAIEPASSLMLLATRNKPETKVVAIDAPSGMCMDSGRFFKGELQATYSDLVVSFHSEKIGHRLAKGPQHCGKVVVKGIGLERVLAVDQVQLVNHGWLSVDEIPQLSKWNFNHKYSHGHALILSGGTGRTGAARLAARGCLRIGAGLVTLGVPPAAQSEVAAQVTAIMLARVGDADALASAMEDERINALCLGPGLGTGTRERDLLAAVLGCPPPPSPPHKGEGGRANPTVETGNDAAREDERVPPAIPLPLVGRGKGRGASPRAVVLDADALTILSENADLFEALHERCILTPHGGEFASLFPDLAEKLNVPATEGPAYSKVDATREAAKRAGCLVLFKGPDTVIANPSGRCSINSAHYDRAAPWLATAGSGDVLAGFITGLLARGFAPMQAAETAAWLHVKCALKFGPGLIAEDLPEMLPKVFTDLGL